MNIKFEKAVEKIFEELSKLNEKEFRELLEKHKDGDYAKIIQRTKSEV
jgi:hypothetical protein